MENGSFQVVRVFVSDVGVAWLFGECLYMFLGILLRGCYVFG